MASSVISRSFSGGEISPALSARADLVKYQTGLKTCRNFVVQRFGGVENRAGTELVCEVKDSSKVVRSVPFVFNDEQTYHLEFGDLYVRIVEDGGQVRETGVVISGATQAMPVVITAAAHGYSTGDEVYVSGVVGMTELNGKNYHVTVLGVNTLALANLDDEEIDGTAFSAYSSAGTAERIYTVTTPYVEADLATLQYEQEGDVITITHNNYAPRELTRTALTSWTLTTIGFAPGIDGPDGIVATAGAAGSTVFKYRVTAIREETYEESLSGYELAVGCAFDRTVTPWAVFSAGHGYSTGDEVLIRSESVAAAGLSGITFTITVIDVDNFTLDDTTADGGASPALEAHRTVAVVEADDPTDADPIIITWDEEVDSIAVEYNIYKELNGVYGYIGTAVGTTFADTNIAPDVTDQPPTDRNVFAEANDYPATVSYFQQRLCFASTLNDLRKAWCSQIGNFHNLSISTPANDDDSVTFTVAGRKVGAIRHLVELARLMIFAAGSIWTVRGDSDGVLRPGAINLERAGDVGCSTLRPIIVGNKAVFLQARQSVIHSLSYDVEANGYDGKELSIFADHLFKNHTIVDMAYQEKPHSVVWAVRDDGVLLGMTYLPEHDVLGWHRHDTQGGTVENVCCIPEGSEDALYLVVRRVINGVERRFIERMHTRLVTDVTTDAFFVDCGLTYDGRNTTAMTMTLSGGTTWAAGESLTLTASASFFALLDIGNAIVLQLLDDDGEISDELTLDITGYTGPTIVTVEPTQAVAVGFRAVALSDWSRAVDEVTGLDHLEGETVAILADGNELTQRVVTDGTIMLSNTFSVIHVGLPIEADLETLSLETVNAETWSDKQKIISQVTALVENSRGMKVGPDEDHLQEWIQRTAADESSALELYTGATDPIRLDSTWEKNGRVFIRQSSPLPLSVLAVVPSGRIGG